MLMPILRLVLIYLVLAAAVVGVFNRDKLGQLVFGAEQSETAPMTASAPAPQEATPLAAQPAEITAPVATSQPEPQPAQPQYPPASLDETVAAAPVQPTPAPMQPTPLAGSSARGSSTLQTPMPPQAAAPQVPVAQETTPLSAPTPEPTQPAPTAMTDPAIGQAVNAARAAYWAGDTATAEAQLAELVAAHPDNADLHGELGNFRFSQRDYPGAAEAYLAAGELLVSQGRYGQAAALVPVLSQIAPDKAQALASRLQSR